MAGYNDNAPGTPPGSAIPDWVLRAYAAMQGPNNSAGSPDAPFRSQVGTLPAPPDVPPVTSSMFTAPVSPGTTFGPYKTPPMPPPRPAGLTAYQAAKSDNSGGLAGGVPTPPPRPPELTTPDWGNPDSASDFFRADRQNMAGQRVTPQADMVGPGHWMSPTGGLSDSIVQRLMAMRNPKAGPDAPMDIHPRQGGLTDFFDSLRSRFG